MAPQEEVQAAWRLAWRAVSYVAEDLRESSAAKALLDDAGRDG